MVLRGIFMLRKKELDWFYQEGASKIFPDAWERFIEPIEMSKRDNLISAYYEIFKSDDEDKKLEAAIAWSRWEGSTVNLSYSPEMADSFSKPNFALAFALIENHYFINKGFLSHEQQLLDGIDSIRNIPATIIQGRYDVCTPVETAWELHKNWPEAKFIITPFSGHSAFEKENTHELILATDRYGGVHK